MTLFPPGAEVALRIDGRPVPAYVRAFVADGRVFAPVRPLLSAVADRLWFDGDALVIVRDGRIVRVLLGARTPDALDSAYVAIAPVLRSLGENVRYDARRRTLDVRSPAPQTVASPTPFDAAAPTSAPRIVFTPEPVATPRPQWTGSPLPRRTPLPAPTPR